MLRHLTSVTGVAQWTNLAPPPHIAGGDDTEPAAGVAEAHALQPNADYPEAAATAAVMADDMATALAPLSRKAALAQAGTIVAMPTAAGIHTTLVAGGEGMLMAGGSGFPPRC